MTHKIRQPAHKIRHTGFYEQVDGFCELGCPYICLSK